MVFLLGASLTGTAYLAAQTVVTVLIVVLVVLNRTQYSIDSINNVLSSITAMIVTVSPVNANDGPVASSHSRARQWHQHHHAGWGTRTVADNYVFFVAANSGLQSDGVPHVARTR